MLKYIHLKNVGSAPEMRMDLAPRMNLITGDAFGLRRQGQIVRGDI